ncbi:MAG: hypothetical protein NPINA01_10430 [Nitrospinaceae bacterium]|nr:MAG: hypothetical protein NPINA01_10430 [Nitrospinaceae bacterium]
MTTNRGAISSAVKIKSKEFQEVLYKLCTDSAFRARVEANHEILFEYELTPFQSGTLMSIGQETGHYSFAGGPGFCCCCGAVSATPDLGPLTSLAGTWEGNEGYDTAPARDGKPKLTRYREEIKFEPIGPVRNGSQLLYGLEFSKMIWRLDNNQPFHEELGYWLWDSRAKQVLRCFIVPRGISVIAGGTAEPDAGSFDLVAEAGSETYGICSNKYLDEERKTVRYELNITIHDTRSFSYYQDSLLKIKGQSDLFHHTDKNTLFLRN